MKGTYGLGYFGRWNLAKHGIHVGNFIKRGLCSASSHDGIIGTRFLPLTLTTKTQDKYENNCFHILYNKQYRSMIPERKEASKVRPTALPLLTPAFCLEAFSGLWPRRGLPSQVQQSCWVEGLEIWVWGKGRFNLWVRLSNRRELLSKRCPEIKIGFSWLICWRLICPPVVWSSHGLGTLQALTSQNRKILLITQDNHQKPPEAKPC